LRTEEYHQYNTNDTNHSENDEERSSGFSSDDSLTSKQEIYDEVTKQQANKTNVLVNSFSNE